ncbi:hypothetical protein [Polaromonas naphthalenivorans]|uniref:Uncharacterized protein n=1 Tax=Polaromonas naphthalenivorans (strain CJ2) TaxID=365044 RepID=A1VU97_POLNA|nr:hypothetical protein [Polaromonas naphthalenivorans]ABM39225.1 hypothetical protein Pnap_3929 [Polaromonas naphthalenivorans CJ2]
MNELRKETIKQILLGANLDFQCEVVSQSFMDNGWTLHPVYFNEKIVGGIVEKDGSIHTSISPDYQKKWNPRPYIKSILYPALDKYGILYSEALKSDHRAIKWLTKLGFIYLKDDSEKIFFQLKEVIYKF